MQAVGRYFLQLNDCAKPLEPKAPLAGARNNRRLPFELLGGFVESLLVFRSGRRCSPSRGVSVAAANVDYAAMMRHLGYARIDDKATGSTYHAGGLIERTRTVRRLAVARSIRPNTYCYDDCSPYEVANYFGVEG